MPYGGLVLQPNTSSFIQGGVRLQDGVADLFRQELRTGIFWWSLSFVIDWHATRDTDYGVTRDTACYV